MHAESNTLAAAACRGDKDALTSLVDLLYPRIYAFLRRLAGNDSDASDLTQKAFVQFCKALPSFGSRSSIASWLHSIAYHCYVDWRRANHRTDTRSETWWAELPSHSALPDELATRNDSSHALYRVVDQMDPELRDSIYLHYYQELTLEETADAMGVATSTVKYRLRQALGQLERHFQDERLASGSSSARPNFL